MQSSDTISTKMHPATCRTKFEKMTEPITHDKQNFKWVLVGLPWTYHLQQVRFNIAMILFHLTYHHTLHFCNVFCHNIKTCCNLRTFWETLFFGLCSFWSKTVFFGQEVHYSVVHITYQGTCPKLLSNFFPVKGGDPPPFR